MENPNSIWAGAFLDELARSGVRIICVAPGSRSTPLVLAAAQDSRFQTISIVDERSAGFFALGVGKATGVPAAVITTSGTAGANLYPSVIEAAQGEVPLLVLTADRPHRLRDTDANQAMDQLRLFGAFPRAFFEIAPARIGDGELRHLRGQACRAVALAKGPPMGPVHANFPFEKPLEPVGEGRSSEGPPSGDSASPEGDGEGTPGTASQVALAGRSDGAPYLRISEGEATLSEAEGERLVSRILGARKGLIVVGPSSDDSQGASAILALGRATGFPVLADPLSGVRFGPDGGAQIISAYDLFLRSRRIREALVPDLILRIGASPTSSALLNYLENHEAVPQVVMDGGHRWKDHTATGHEYVRAAPGPVLESLLSRIPQGEAGGPGGDPDLQGGTDLSRSTGEPPALDAQRAQWKGRWTRMEEETWRALDEKSREEMLEGWILESAAELLPPGTNLLVSSSMPIRDLDAFGRPRQEPLRVFGNRGTSGIDGLVSTTLGIASASEGPTVGILGDLALFHDMNGLLAVMQQKLPAGFVVVNNDGGGIFHTLPVRDHDPAFTRFFATPHDLDFKAVADLYGLRFARTETVSGFRETLPLLLSGDGPFLLEVVTDREKNHALRRAIIQEITEAAVCALEGE